MQRKTSFGGRRRQRRRGEEARRRPGATTWRRQRRRGRRGGEEIISKGVVNKSDGVLTKMSETKKPFLLLFRFLIY
ncbi:hypothetical protein LINPERPRIM_LOCUS5585 [Linum perenne]